MAQKRLRRQIGTYLKKLREEANMSRAEVSRYLSYYDIKCSRSNIIRIEDEDGMPRGDILAGLGLIYEVSVDSIVYC